MFVHKSKPLALSFAALVMGLVAGPAQADRKQGDYCSAPEVCNQRQIGIIQKERDGVNYFYGGSDVPPPQVTYIYLRGDNLDQPAAEPVYISNSYDSSFTVPQSRHKKDHWKWKKKHHHQGPLDLPGGNAGVNYKGP